MTTHWIQGLPILLTVKEDGVRLQVCDSDGDIGVTVKITKGWKGSVVEVWNMQYARPRTDRADYRTVVR